MYGWLERRMSGCRAPTAVKRTESSFVYIRYFTVCVSDPCIIPLSIVYTLPHLPLPTIVRPCMPCLKHPVAHVTPVIMRNRSK